MNYLSSLVFHHDYGDGFLESGWLLAVEAELFALLYDFSTHGGFLAIYVFVKRKIETCLLGIFSRYAIAHEALLYVFLGDLQVDAGVVEVLEVVFKSHVELAIVLVLPLDLVLESLSPVIGVLVVVVPLELELTPGVAEVNQLLIFAVSVFNFVSGQKGIRMSSDNSTVIDLKFSVAACSTADTEAKFISSFHAVEETFSSNAVACLQLVHVFMEEVSRGESS